MEGKGDGKRRWLWVLWLVSALLLCAWLAYSMLKGSDKSLFMPGPMTSGHHQLALACDACHTSPLGGGEVLQQACVDCHGAERRKPFDSHPAAKFTDPRNADRLQKIDATVCISCHTEHRPEITAKNGLTQPLDLCVHCHEEVAEDRPSHAGMPFDSCANSGCHNYHDNRALYTDFLYKHRQDPDLLEQPRLPAREFAAVLGEIMDYPLDRYPVEPLGREQADAPEAADDALQRDWLETAHAAAGVNCSACHVVADTEEATPRWTDHPGEQGCAQCHGLEIDRFRKGKHGMRLAVGLEPMTPHEARLPMRPEAAHEQLTCNSCHAAHRFNTRTAAVEGCLDCHADPHSLAYTGSPHHLLWQQESAGELPAGSGVSCASCHMPRIDFDVNDWFSRVMVDHNQSANLSPNSKMIRSSCMSCHGLGFTLDALADEALVARNFRGRPAVQVRSIGMAIADHEKDVENVVETP